MCVLETKCSVGEDLLDNFKSRHKTAEILGCQSRTWLPEEKKEKRLELLQYFNFFSIFLPIPTQA